MMRRCLPRYSVSSLSGYRRLNDLASCLPILPLSSVLVKVGAAYSRAFRYIVVERTSR